jgi:UDP-N-acetylmuramyl pentapeptide phosphotransferase/UDP-N-acetylglucosamine-1-phosphate transferase
MFDNVDLSLGIFSIFSLITLFVVNFINNGSINISYLILTYIAALIPFLIFNKYPSKLFMGDIGSLQLGSIIGAISIKVFWNEFTYDNFFGLINTLIINNLIFFAYILRCCDCSFYQIKKQKEPI